MDRTFYSRRHFERLSNGAPDTPELAAERIAYRNAASRAIAEREALFPQPWADPAAVMDWQARRIAELSGRG